MRFLKKIREKNGASSTQFAVSLGLSPQTYRLYETSGIRINLAKLAQIRAKLGLNWEQLGKMIDEDVKKGREV